MVADTRTIEQKSLHFLTMIAETLETSSFTLDEVQRYLGNAEPEHKECLAWLKQNGYLKGAVLGFGNYSLTEQGDLFLNLVAE